MICPRERGPDGPLSFFVGAAGAALDDERIYFHFPRKLGVSFLYIYVYNTLRGEKAVSGVELGCVPFPGGMDRPQEPSFSGVQLSFVRIIIKKILN